MALLDVVDPQKLGALILKMRWAKDNPPDPAPSADATSALTAFTTNLDSSGDEKRKELLKAATVQKTEGELQGNEVAFLFEEEATGQWVDGWKTMGIVPTRADISKQWKIPEQDLYTYFRNNSIDVKYLEALGVHIFQRCLL